MDDGDDVVTDLFGARFRGPCGALGVAQTSKINFDRFVEPSWFQVGALVEQNIALVRRKRGGDGWGPGPWAQPRGLESP